MTHDDYLRRLGVALRELRLGSGLMQKEVATITGMSRSQVSRYERGRDIPNLVTLTKYLLTVGATFEDLHNRLVSRPLGRYPSLDEMVKAALPLIIEELEKRQLIPKPPEPSSETEET